MGAVDRDVGIIAREIIRAGLMAVGVVVQVLLNAQAAFALGEVGGVVHLHLLVTGVVHQPLGHHVAGGVGLGDVGGLNAVGVGIEGVAHHHVAGRVVLVGVGRFVVAPGGDHDLAVAEGAVAHHHPVVGVVGEPIALGVGRGAGGFGLGLNGLGRGRWGEACRSFVCG